MPERIYIDSCVFMNKSFKDAAKKTEKDLAEDFLQKVEDGEYDGVITPFVILEIMTAGRRMLIRRTKKPMDEIEKEVLEALENVSRMQNLYVYPNPRIHIDIDKALHMAQSFGLKYPGKIVKYRPGTGRPFGRYRDGMLACDLLHLAFALNSDCDEFVTFDKDFKDVDEGITITILRG